MTDDQESLLKKVENKPAVQKIFEEVVQTPANEAVQQLVQNRYAGNLRSTLLQQGVSEAEADAMVETFTREDGTEGMTATVARQLVQQGVTPETAAKIAEVVVAAENGQKLPVAAQELLNSVSKNEKLSAAIRQASGYMNTTAEEAFANMAEDYAGSNNVIANMSQVNKNAFLSLHDPKVNASGGQFAHAMAAAYSLGYNNQAIGDLNDLADGPLLASLTDLQRDFCLEARS